MSFYGAAAYYIAQLRNTTQTPEPAPADPNRLTTGSGTWLDDLWCAVCQIHRIRTKGELCPPCADDAANNGDEAA